MKKNYKFFAIDGKYNEIELKFADVFYGITEEQARFIRTGIEMGLTQKYKEPIVSFREVK